MSDSRGAAALAWLRADARRFDLVVAVLTIGVGLALSRAEPDRFDTGWPDAVAGVGAFLLLTVRSRWPWPAFLIAITWTVIHVSVLERPTLLIFAVLVLLATVCLRLERRQAIALGIAIAIGLYVIGLVVTDADTAGDTRAVIGIAWSAVAIGVADAVRSWRRLKETSEAQVRAAVLAAEAQAREQVSEERLTIARELHDLLAHNLSVMNVQTGAALHLLRDDPDQAEQSLTAARDAGRSVLDELRELLAVLRHDEGDDAPTTSLPSIDQIESLVETMRNAGLDVEWTRSGAPRPLAPAVSLAAYRITQEALTNAAKHGGGSARLTTTFEEGGWSVQVVNDTSDTSPTDSGHGLVGMRERALSNGGRLSAGHENGRFIVDAWLPAAPDREVLR